MECRLVEPSFAGWHFPFINDLRYMKRILFLAFACVFSVMLCVPAMAAEDDVARMLEKHVEYLAADSLKGRLSGTDGNRKAAEYIYNVMRSYGLEMIYPEPGQSFSLTVEGDSLNSVNVLGMVEGYDPEFKDEVIVVGAHYDNIGSNSISINGIDCLQVYPGADNDASGVAVLLEVSKAVKENSYMFRRPVVFVCFGAEEQGLYGSWYFTHGGIFNVRNIRYMLNLDMVGRSGDNNRFSVFTDCPGVWFEDLLHKVSFRQAGISPAVLAADPFPSSHAMFHNAGIPVSIFTTGLHSDMNTVRDTPDKLDYEMMNLISRYVYFFIEELSSADAMPESLSMPESVPDEGRDEGEVLSIHDVDVKPTFLNGDELYFLNKWVYYYVKYPESAIENGTQGTVVVEFIVETDGKVSNVEIVKGLSEDIDREVLKVVSASPKWKAARLGNVKKRVKLTLPVEFRLK